MCYCSRTSLSSLCLILLAPPVNNSFDFSTWKRTYSEVCAYFKDVPAKRCRPRTHESFAWNFTKHLLGAIRSEIFREHAIPLIGRERESLRGYLTAVKAIFFNEASVRPSHLASTSIAFTLLFFLFSFFPICVGRLFVDGEDTTSLYYRLLQIFGRGSFGMRRTTWYFSYPRTDVFTKYCDNKLNWRSYFVAYVESRGENTFFFFFTLNCIVNLKITSAKDKLIIFEEEV